MSAVSSKGVRVFRIVWLVASVLIVAAEGRVHKVESGETFYGIVKSQASQCGLSHKKMEERILQLNKSTLSEETKGNLKIGQTLQLPDCGGSSRSGSKKPTPKRKVAASSPGVEKTNHRVSGAKGCDANARKRVSHYSAIVDCRDNHIIWRDGTRMLYDDGRTKKDFKYLLNHADIEDMFRFSYRRGPYSHPPKNYDPGRIRNEAFFRKMYGNSPAEVRRHLTTVDWFGRQLRVTTVNGVADHLRAVVRDLKKLGPEYRKYLVPPGGTFTWRTIAGTHRLSVHSFGAAIDINVKYSNYWRWTKGKYRYINHIPLKIVKIFERHGFIWGGKGTTTIRCISSIARSSPIRV